ncbi:hypothetical protein M405DRAFT_844825 [Rhizopogon salebrosus TDB-379]|nr:hypothetical protein M405DRAFT_844825 [Rhizopogon salebrosus TDB-379]
MFSEIERLKCRSAKERAGSSTCCYLVPDDGDATFPLTSLWYGLNDLQVLMISSRYFVTSMVLIVNRLESLARRKTRKSESSPRLSLSEAIRPTSSLFDATFFVCLLWAGYLKFEKCVPYYVMSVIAPFLLSPASRYGAAMFPIRTDDGSNYSKPTVYSCGFSAGLITNVNSLALTENNSREMKATNFMVTGGAMMGHDARLGAWHWRGPGFLPAYFIK